MMKYFLVTLGLLLNIGLVYCQENLIIPAPATFKFQQGRLILTNDFTISLKGTSQTRVFGASVRMLTRLKNRTGIFITQYKPLQDSTRATMFIMINRPGKNQLSEDESYRLTIDSSKITLNSQTDLGALHGIETLLQLLQTDGKVYYFPGCVINDSPRFPWRGLLIDVGRHFMPVDIIKHNIDGMAAVKMNVLHFHLTEDQGFRIECKAFPKLHQLGSDDLYYTQDQIRDLIAYADNRGVRIVPEFDIPGHASSWFVGYPELASGSGPYHISENFGILIPSMNPAKEITYQFLDTFFKEMTALFPDEYMHIGGDENNGIEWDNNPAIQEFKSTHNLIDNNALQAFFNHRILDILTKYGKKMVGWDEIIQPQLPRNIVIQSWRKDGLTEAVKAGFPVILSRGYYIDLMQPAESYYKIDPLPDSLGLSDVQKKLILGGEATMWTEMVTDETIDSRIWPRTAAIAERLWSPSSVTDISFMYKRLDRISIQLEELGLMHERNGDFILRRLTGDYDNKALKTLVDVLEPVKQYHRVSAKEVTYTTHAPFGRIVDAARPDTRVAREFNALVDTFLNHRSNKQFYNELRGYFKGWIHNDKDLEPIISKVPALNEIEPLSTELAEISGLGLQALVFLRDNRKPQRAWRQNCMAQLKQATKSKGQVEIAVIKGISELVQKVR